MTSDDGAGSSGRIIEDQYITAPISAGRDGITVYGSDGPVVIIRRCVVDLGSWPLESLDEGLSGVDGARAVVRETRVSRVGKAILWSNGDYPDTDPDAELVLEDCIIRDVGRRAPEAQDGVRVIMRRCVIRNWGIGSRFTVRSCGAWAHDGARIRAEDCVFWQDRFWQAGLWGFVVDLANWIGWCFNRRDWNPLHWLLPGVCRGLTASQKGKVSASRCWTNRWWIRLQGHRGPRMSKREALALMAELEGRLL